MCYDVRCLEPAEFDTSGQCENTGQIHHFYIESEVKIQQPDITDAPGFLAHCLLSCDSPPKSGRVHQLGGLDALVNANHARQHVSSNKAPL
ncbi:hypothetical protein LSAT2_025600 [Lamellibrachia satsuma]|nr:hypothetical protein LSAT2_025600 [Lamellibrachia satsuma]